jgi:hypothetical protein
MFIRFRALLLYFGLAISLIACHSNSNSTSQSTNQVSGQPANPSEYQEFVSKFKDHAPPVSVPADMEDKTQLDKKFIADMLAIEFTPAFGSEDILPAINDNIETAKYFAGARIKLDSVDAFIIHKQGEDDYYFLCLFDKTGKLTDGTCIAFTEGTTADGSVRQASIDKDGSFEISQFDVIKGKPDKASSERHFYEVTSKGKIRDLKENANPANS